MIVTIKFSKGNQSFIEVLGDEIAIEEIAENMTDGWAAVQIIKPDVNCNSCHGSGTVTDYVPYGMGTAGLDSDCDCVTEQWLDIDGLGHEISDRR